MAPRSKRPAVSASAPIPSATPTATTPTRFVSRVYLESLGIDSTTISAQTAGDSNVLYDVINKTPWVTMDNLVKWANINFGTNPVDRLNTALAVLDQADLINRFDS